MPSAATAVDDGAETIVSNDFVGGSRLVLDGSVALLLPATGRLTAPAARGAGGPVVVAFVDATPGAGG